MNYFILIIIFIAAICYILLRLSSIRNKFEGGYFKNKYRNKKEKEKENKKNFKKDLNKHPRSKSEAEVIKIAEEIIGCPMPTINPSWLIWENKQLELDGYCEEKKIALEFSGPLHTKWYPNKESYIKYYDRITKDVVKKRMCKKQKVLLIVIDMRLPKHHYRDYIQSRLWEFNPSLYSEPLNFIIEQNEKPFRNPELEQEYNLNSINIAKKL